MRQEQSQQLFDHAEHPFQESPSQDACRPDQAYTYPYDQDKPFHNTAHLTGATSMNADPRISAGLSYVCGWVTGLLFFLFERRNRYVRFHAMQSLLLSLSFTALYLLASFLVARVFYTWAGLFLLIVGIVGLLGVALWLLCLLSAFQGRYIKLPLLGNYAERIANSGAPRQK